jgi:hypothetical protein
MGPMRNPRWEQKRTEGYVIVSNKDNLLIKDELFIKLKSFFLEVIGFGHIWDNFQSLELCLQ